MAGASKIHRISKVAAELNVSWKNLIEHLIDEGFEVDNKMTAKIDAEMYSFLQNEFASDKEAKEESKALEINIRREKETLTANRKSPEAKKKEPDEDVVLIKDTGLSGKPRIETPPPPPPKQKEEPVKVEKEEIKEEEKQTEAEKEKVAEPEAKVKEPKAEEVDEKEQAPVKEEIKEAKKEEKSGLKILGKIDLPDEKAKKGTKEKAEEKAEPKPEAEKVTKPEEKAEEKKKDKEEKKAVPEIKEEKEEKEEDTVLPTAYEKLKGLNIKGKIVLPEPPAKKKRVASSDEKPDADQRKKRKRKPKEVVKGRKAAPRREDKEEVSDKEIQDKIKATLAKIGSQKGKSQGGNVRSKMRRQRREDHQRTREQEELQKEQESKILKVTEFVTANDLASMMSVGVTEIITACFSLGMMVSINQRLDAETIQIVAEEFGYEVNFVDAESQIEIEEEVDDPKDLKERPPIVTVMGHVDHGKTSLLDFIRSENVIAGEAGGITQHVAAYEVTLKSGKNITFIDTPGHEAFTAMRARGAKVTDVVIIVIAADDNVMPQTKEAIAHAQAANVPIVFAFNKIDKPTANVDKIREELSQMNILVEEWGGKFQAQEISAKKGINIDELLEKVLLEAELLELRANPNKRAKGTVMEAQQEKGRGTTATLLVQEGTLKVGDALVAGHNFCRVRALLNEREQQIMEVGPSTPVKVLGFTTSPTAGDIFQVMSTEQEAKEVANKRAQLQREQGIRATKHITLDEIGRRLAVGNFKELKVIVKADVDGSAEALADSLIKLSTEQIQVNVIHKSVGQITESDVLLASASDAIIIGFQVRPGASARKLAEHEEIDIRLYSVIYKAIDEIKSAMEGMLAPELEENMTGNAEVREVFKVSKVGAVAGCMVIDGKIVRDNKVRVIRDGVVIYESEMASLKRFKDDVKEVAKGYECGIQVKNYNDIREGDILECFEVIEVKQKLK